MRIPLPKMMRAYRQKEFESGLAPPAARFGLDIWGFAAARPWLYRLGARLAAGILGWRGRKRGRFTSLPLAGGWTDHRDMAAPAGRTFQDLWDAKRGARSAREARR